ncbi:MAG TPA: hypothetical protein VD813_04625, partial [Pseudonocardia sp.]|nr:hypothetical protein [Pseudonocardia sp.]
RRRRHRDGLGYRGVVRDQGRHLTGSAPMTVPPPGPARPADPRAPGAPSAPEDAVAAAMAELDGLERRPLAEHVEVFERLHAALGEALAAGSPDASAPGRGGPGRAGARCPPVPAWTPSWSAAGWPGPGNRRRS